MSTHWTEHAVSAHTWEKFHNKHDIHKHALLCLTVSSRTHAILDHITRRGQCHIHMLLNLLSKGGKVVDHMTVCLQIHFAEVVTQLSHEDGRVRRVQCGGNSDTC